MYTHTHTNTLNAQPNQGKGTGLFWLRIHKHFIVIKYLFGACNVNVTLAMRSSSVKKQPKEVVWEGLGHRNLFTQSISHLCLSSTYYVPGPGYALVMPW